MCEFLCIIGTLHSDHHLMAWAHGIFELAKQGRKLRDSIAVPVGRSSYACTVFRSHACTHKKIAYSDTVDQNSSVNSSIYYNILQEVTNVLFFLNVSFHRREYELGFLTYKY